MRRNARFALLASALRCPSRLCLQGGPCFGLGWKRHKQYIWGAVRGAAGGFPVQGAAMSASSPVSETIELAREADFMLGALAVHPSTSEVVAGDKRESIQPRVMQVLVALARADGAV